MIPDEYTTFMGMKRRRILGSVRKPNDFRGILVHPWRFFVLVIH